MYLVPSLTFVVGHGVFTTKQFKEGEFLLHYDGDLLSSTEARKKRRSYDPSIGTFQYEFRYREKRLWYVANLKFLHVIHDIILY